ncbi:MAG: LapA family protein [Deltaproteobacteria bacterium]|nr:MAG: LapA family protein [Deltaproteobacteria bacterium]UCH08629.1 MAG: LapA family protein [Deltaproteobacteria bacterium]
MRHVKAIASILVMLFVVIIVVENLEQLSKTLTLRIDLLFWGAKTGPMAFYLVVIIAFLIGVFVAGLLGIFERFRLKREIKRLSKENKEKDKELNSYRNLPIVEEEVEDTSAVVATNSESALSNNDRAV